MLPNFRMYNILDIENNTWARGDMKFIFECSTPYRDLTREDQFHISKLPCIILFII